MIVAAGLIRHLAWPRRGRIALARARHRPRYAQAGRCQAIDHRGRRQAAHRPVWSDGDSAHKPA